YGERDFTAGQIDEALIRAQIHEEVAEFPEHNQTLLGERGINISGGQKQRLTLARAFIQNSDLLILDDCLSSVDSETETKMLETIRKYRKNHTMIIVSHRLSAIKDADIIFFMDSGRITETGTHNSLVEINGKYSEFVKRQLISMELERL
ncbi:MAG: ATP-binding cassette domain-containing protein, partial [bacterium]